MRSPLILLTGFTGFTAMISGAMMMIAPEGHLLDLNLDWLKQTPFTDFFIPGLILALAVGGTNLNAMLKVIFNKKQWFAWAFLSGFITGGWIIVQIIMIRYFYWLHVVYLGAAFFTVLLAYQLKGKWLA